MTKLKTTYSLRSFLSYLVQRGKWQIGLTLSIFVVANLFLAVIPVFIGKLVGALTSPGHGHQAILYMWALILCSTFHNLTWRAAEFSHLKLVGPLSFYYENILFRQVMQKPYPYFVDKFTGKLSSYITTISQDQRQFLNDVCYNYTSQLVSLVAMLIILASVNWQTGVIFSVGVLGMYIVGRYAIRNSTRYERLDADVQSTKNAKIIDAIANFVNIKSFRKEATEIRTIAIEQQVAIKANQKSQFWAIFFWSVMSEFVRDLIWPAVIGLNVYLYLHGELSLAKLSIVLSTLLVFSNTIWELIWYISQFNLRIARAEEAHRYLFGEVNIMRSESLDRQTADGTTKPFTESLELRNLNFAYPDKTDTPVLRGLNLQLKRGEKLGIVGKSGSGKSTLTKLLLGYYDVPAEQILLDGKPTNAHDIADIIAYVPQDTTLFHRSISENIAYASSHSVTQKEIVKAAKLAHADEFIQKITDGYDALVGERGVKLSVGQRQRIAIARAFLDDKPLLILDEATSALDSESEVLVQQALESLWHNKTVIAIAHRLSTLRHMDKIAVMDGGRIIELGSHHELLAAKGIYAKLWAHQSGGFIEE
ncbi:MAG TPA: ABC transporter ATP-binding protein [Candidatus Saccharimonadia bacterium]|nr:ABC transporter ATP-binding protein [Candidatus Saccharimonadia bacterium]